MIERNGDEVLVDARPSDAIALAVAGNTPIFVEDHVLDEVAGPTDPGRQLQRCSRPPWQWRHGRRSTRKQARSRRGEVMATRDGIAA